MKVLIATQNSGKIEGAKKALEHFFDSVDIQGIPTESNVGEQPLNDEIYTGAKNRIRNLKKYAKDNNLEADYYLAIESGIFNTLANWMITSVAIVSDNDGMESCGTGPSLPVPDRLAQEIIDTDLSDVMNKIFDKDDERHKRGGGIQLLTHNIISRIDINEAAFVMALTKYINGDKWK